MGRLINDNVKRQLLDKLAEEPTIVLSTAYAYAKNYVMYGEDITKAWTTAVQQASILEQVRQKAWVEAYDSFKKEYENRLKADMVAMLEELKEQLREMHEDYFETEHYDEAYGVSVSMDEIQEKINELKQEPTTKNDLGVDCISRQAVEDAMYDATRAMDLNYGQIMEYIDNLPSVTPIRPKGHWIPVRVDRYSEQYGHFKINEYKCSNCNSEFEYGYHNYCPYCGAKMVEPQESEDKE